MRIVLLARSLDPGGAERQIVALAGALAGRGHRVEVLTFYSGGLLEPELTEAGVPVVDLAKRGRWRLFGVAHRLLRHVRRSGTQVVYGFLVAPNLLACLCRLLPDRPSIVWGVRAADMDFRRYGPFQELTFQVSRRASRLADRIVANSRAGARYHARLGFPAERIAVVPNGIDTNRFRPDADRRRRVRAGWGIDPGQKVIGIAARLDPMKDHETFLKAAGLLARVRGDVRFVCVGTGPATLERSLRWRTAELGLGDRVRWVGFQADMCAAYNGFDLATSSSSSEGFSNAIAEAMACGVPCVATRVGDAEEILGDPALVVPPRDPARLARAWSDWLEGRIAPSRAMLRGRIVHEFSLEACAERTEAVFRTGRARHAESSAGGSS